jgi:uncharacterized protein YacL
MTIRTGRLAWRLETLVTAAVVCLVMVLCTARIVRQLDENAALADARAIRTTAHLERAVVAPLAIVRELQELKDNAVAIKDQRDQLSQMERVQSRQQPEQQTNQ